MLKTLTLHQPWSGVVAAGIKRIENRSWAPPKGIIGQRLAIHAGKTWDAKGADYCRERIGHEGYADWPPLCNVRGAVVAVTTVVGVMEVGAAPGREYTDQVQPWFFGPYGWLLRDTVALSRPVPCRGAQGLWELPGDVERAVLDQPGRRGFPVTGDALDAPDGAVVDVPGRGGLFERHGLRWEPVGRKEGR